jgi:hypothetical protein
MNIIDQSEKVHLLVPPANRKNRCQDKPVDLDYGEDTDSDAMDSSGSEVGEDDEAQQAVAPERSQPNEVEALSLLPGEEAKIVRKSYLHLGVEWGLTGKSPGTAHCYLYVGF